MRLKLLLFVSVFLMGLHFLGSGAPSAFAGTAVDCEAQDTGNFTPLGSINFNFACGAEQVVYFGVCDSGSVPNDDLFDVYVNGVLVSYNYYIGGTDEYTVASTIKLPAGTHTATVNSLNNSPYPPATYSYIASTDPAAIPAYLISVCGVDWKGLGPGPSAGCNTNVPIFTEDTAPSNGTLEFHVLLGNEAAIGDEINFATIPVSAGDQLNNVYVNGVPAPRYVRVWWQPDGSTDWWLLTTQYWHGGGSLADEYGVSCVGSSGPPSYHTSFAAAVPHSEVCYDLMNGCP